MGAFDIGRVGLTCLMNRLHQGEGIRLHSGSKEPKLTIFRDLYCLLRVVLFVEDVET